MSKALILLFLVQTWLQNSNVGVKYRGRKILLFLTEIAVYFGNGMMGPFTIDEVIGPRNFR